MAKESKAQKETVERVMHEYKHGELRIRGNGPKVKNPKQAIAIALNEAGASKYNSPSENKEHLSRTKRRERQGKTAQARKEGGSARRRSEPTRAELYERAKKRQIPGRSKMNKAELQKALG